MNAEYSSDTWLPLSGIQHFVFCRRQWGLIHVERQWQENVLTAEGRIMHHRADDPFFTEKRKDVILARSVPVSSPKLGLSGVCDVVEFAAATEGISLLGREGFWMPTPVEYKRGKAKQDHCDEVQLCAQAMCLEEMLVVLISQGYLYYREIRRRIAIPLTADLRDLVRKTAKEMHAYFEKGYTPRVKPSKTCVSCSLAEVCLPQLQGSTMSVAGYIRQQLERV